MDKFQNLIEQKIEESIARGEFNNLPGAGKPIELDDDSGVPDELKVSYRMLKNSGFRPAEVELKMEIEKLKEKLNLKINELNNFENETELLQLRLVNTIKTQIGELKHTTKNLPPINLTLTKE